MIKRTDDFQTLKLKIYFHSVGSVQMFSLVKSSVREKVDLSVWDLT
jgi:hypothetical protein